MNEKVNDVLSVPVMPEQTETERKLKNNLMIFSVVFLFMYWGGLSIDDKSRIMGVTFKGLTQDKIYFACLLFIVYASIHYMWLIKDSLSNWRIRCTAISELRAIRAGEALGTEVLKDKRNNTLYHWWNHAKVHIQDRIFISEALIQSISHLEVKIQDEEFSADTHLLLGKLDDVKELIKNSAHDFEELKELLSSDPFTVALPRFNNSFRLFIVSQNIRWFFFDFLAPFVLAIVSLGILTNHFMVSFIALISPYIDFLLHSKI